MTAPPPKQRVVNCRKKRRYSDEFAARAGAQLFLEQVGDNAIGIYRCDQCGGWHMTHHAARKLRVTREDLFLQPSYKEPV